MGPEYNEMRIIYIQMALLMVPFSIFVKLREREGQRVDSGSRLSIVDCRLLIVDIDFPEALH